MSAPRQERILLVDTNSRFRESLAQALSRAGYEAVEASTGEQAFLILRNWHNPVDWLYSRTVLPVLIDGWILADEYHDSHPRRAVVLAAPRWRPSERGDVILADPSSAAALEAIIAVIEAAKMPKALALAAAGAGRRAA